MIVYHWDRNGSLPLGTIDLINREQQIGTPVNFFDHNGISNMGKVYLSDYQLSSLRYEKLTELVFELVRQSRFPDKPSRFQSILAATSLEGAEQWRRELDPEGKCEGKIHRIECSAAFDADAAWRDAIPHVKGGAVYSPVTMFNNAVRYWSGTKFMSHSRMEAIVPLPAVVLD